MQAVELQALEAPTQVPGVLDQLYVQAGLIREVAGLAPGQETALLDGVQVLEGAVPVQLLAATGLPAPSWQVQVVLPELATGVQVGFSLWLQDPAGSQALITQAPLPPVQPEAHDQL